jgi:osmotically-inducible protein OsmY
VVYLQGHLPTYYRKQVAQELAAGVSGVRRVINRIKIQSGGSRDGRPPIGRDSARHLTSAPVSLR